MLRVRVCRVDELADGEMRGFAIEGLERPLLLARIDGELHATASTCPHEDVSLLDGTLRGRAVVCPGHAYAFDLATGRCAHDPALRLPRHRLVVIGDEVFVDLVTHD